MEFYEFYQKENVENWLTEEQWDYNEENKYLNQFRNATFVELCTNKKRTPVLNLKIVFEAHILAFKQSK